MAEKTHLPIIPGSFDDIVREEKKDIFVEEFEVREKKKEKTTEEQFAEERLKWTKKIQDMSAMLKKIMEIHDLLTDVYTQRQLALEYYHYLITLMSNINIKYRKEYAVTTS
jgi:hypothetical protein